MIELTNETWLSPGKIQVSNVLQGDRVKQSITIHNGSDDSISFLVFYRIPDYAEDSFIAAPVNAQNWINIGEESAVLEPQETKEIEIILELPTNTQIPERWEFWIGVKANTSASLTTELCSRWLITMRD